MLNKKTAFFGTSQFSVYVLESLKKNGFIPDIIITGEDKPKGRNLTITPPPVKIWAEKNKILFYQPKTLKDGVLLETLKKDSWDVFIVASYGKIIPKEIIDLPENKTLNIHPSLLPKLRGASPIQSSILTEEKTGVTIMLLDEEMDHGPIVAQEEVFIQNWPPKAEELQKILAEKGAEILYQILPNWFSGKIKPIPQNHSEATYTKKIQKEDGLIDLEDYPQENYRKIQAYTPWPSAYFFLEHKGKKIRVIIKEAKLKDGKLEIIKILPEGKKEMSYKDFIKNIKK